MFGKPDKKRVVEVDGKQIELQDKPSAVSKLFGAKPAPIKAATPTSPITSQNPATPTPVAPSTNMPLEQKPAPKPLFSFAQKPATPKSSPQISPTPNVPPTIPAQSQPSTTLITPITPKSSAPSQPHSLYFFPKSTVVPNKPAPPPKPAAPPKPMKPAPVPKAKPAPSTVGQAGTAKRKGPGRFELLVEGIGAKHPALEMAMRKQGMKQSVYEFIKRIIIISCMFAIVIGAVSFVIFSKILPTITTAALLAVMLAFAVMFVSYNTFLNFPNQKSKSSSKQVERDILFAARDLIIALRSGMPLFNAITSVSSGYGEASKEFLKIVEKVQLGMPLEDAIDKTVEETKSPSFRKIMLQASVSIRVGADVTSALQSVIDQLAQERVIELRRYGQRLNAIAMFYMLFGIIVPSMGIAVLTILTTFIPLITINMTILEFVLVGITFLQVVFLQMIRSSRPVFTL